MEEFPKPEKEELLAEHTDVHGPEHELELPMLTPEETETKTGTSPEIIRQSVDNLPEQWKKDEERNNDKPNTPTLH